MRITPWTPTKELKRLLSLTYVSQAFSLVILASALCAVYLVYEMAMIAMDTTSFATRLAMAAMFGLSILCFIKAIRNCLNLFFEAGGARAALRDLIAEKQERQS